MMLYSMPSDSFAFLPDSVFIGYNVLFAACFEFPICLIVGYVYDVYRYPQRALFILKAINFCLIVSVVFCCNVISFTS